MAEARPVVPYSSAISADSQLLVDLPADLVEGIVEFAFTNGSTQRVHAKGQVESGPHLEIVSPAFAVLEPNASVTYRVRVLEDINRALCAYSTEKIRFCFVADEMGLHEDARVAFNTIHTQYFTHQAVLLFSNGEVGNMGNLRAFKTTSADKDKDKSGMKNKKKKKTGSRDRSPSSQTRQFKKMNTVKKRGRPEAKGSLSCVFPGCKAKEFTCHQLVRHLTTEHSSSVAKMRMEWACTVCPIRYGSLKGEHAVHVAGCGGDIVIRSATARSNVHGVARDIPESTWSPPQGEISGETAQRVHLVNAFRRFGHLEAELDPLGLAKTRDMPELSPETYGLKSNASVNAKHSVDDLVDQLRSIYCGPLAIEFMHISNWEERDWLARHFESTISSELRNEERVKLAKTMIRVENFDHFLATKFASLERYGCEGAEAMFGFFAELFDSAPERGTEQIMLCIAHRGRLNLLTELMHFPTVQLFRKMRGKPEFPSDVQGSGDVLSHLTSSFDHSTPDGSVHITMLPNPSHLEAINPVAMGKARARASTIKKGDYSKEKDARSGDGVLCVQVHGDGGAFSGQGVLWETLALSQVPHFRTGGSIHLVTNNQVAFTAEGHVGRSTTHCTDIAKAIDCPVIHVNGDNPEEVVAATRLALDYRNKFRKDVFINMICFCRWGHNELDDPSFTQQLMYKVIESRRSVPTEYTERLIMEGVITQEEIDNEKKAHTDKLLESFRSIEATPPVANHLSANWTGMAQAPPSIERWDTGVDLDLLRFVGAASVQTKDGFECHPHLKKTHVDARLTKLTSGEGIDWATAEALAVGSLLTEGIDVRFSGQDVGRGTFCHRHAMLVDQKTDECFIPLNSIHDGQKAFYEVANNLLSEEAILGFEYGYSLDSPRRLCVWEAQFGDFFNGAQIIIDTFIASAESKWLTQSGLTMLLPHGFDGAGPEHSSCRMERFLQLCDSREDQTPVDGENVNMRIANPTTAAQYFHLLRRQVVPNYRKPLIVVGPKILLRHPQAASTLAEFAPGTSFQNVITEKKEGNKIEKVIFVSGKHWIAVDKARKERGLDEKVAIVRVESLSPFPVADLQSTLKQYPNAKSLVWSQEEPRNAGAWSFVNPRFENAVGVKLKFAGRRELAHTATAIGQFHAEENEAVMRDTFE